MFFFIYCTVYVFKYVYPLLFSLKSWTLSYITFLKDYKWQLVLCLEIMYYFT